MFLELNAMQVIIIAFLICSLALYYIVWDYRRKGKLSKTEKILRQQIITEMSGKPTLKTMRLVGRVSKKKREKKWFF